MYIFGECNNKCIENIEPSYFINENEIEFIDVIMNTSYMYCIKIFSLNYDSIYTSHIIKEIDLLQSIVGQNDILFDIRDNLVLYNIDSSKTRSLINYDLFLNTKYDRLILANYYNCKLIDNNTIQIKDINKPAYITTHKPVVVNDYFSIKTKIKDVSNTTISHKYMISNFEILVTVSGDLVYLKVTGFNNNKTYNIYENKIYQFTLTQDSNISIITKFDVTNSKFNIDLEFNDSNVYSFSENIVPLTLSSIVNKAEIHIEPNADDNIIEANTDISGNMYFSKDKTFKLYKYKFDLLESGIVEQTDDFDNKFLSVGFISVNDDNFTKIRESYKFSSYNFKNYNLYDQVYGFMYTHFDYRFVDYFEVTATSVILEKISLFNKGIQDVDVSSYSIVEDETIEHSYLKYINSQEVDTLLLNAKASNLNPYQCLGYHLKMTTQAREMMRDIHANTIKYSMSYLNINFSLDPNILVNSYKQGLDELGGTTIPGFKIPLTELHSLEMINNKKNRYIYIRGILSDIKDVLRKYLGDDYSSIITDDIRFIFINTISLEIMVNGLMYSMIQESSSLPVKIDTEKDLPIMLTLQY